MKLSELDARERFALLGPGFGGGRFVLVEDLAPSEGAASLVFAPFEAEGEAALRFSGRVRAVDSLELDVDPAQLEPRLDWPEHRRSVEEIREAIARGDVYQVCLAGRAMLAPVSAGALLSAMCARGVPRFAAWVRLPGGRELVSASPELFFEVDGPTVRSEPMKGTARRGAAGELRASDKDKAELAMITDLVRNDLTPICLPRTVKVDAARKFIELPYAVQAVSEVSGRLAENANWIGVLRALHPGGSVTGAPKRAALAMIGRLERHRRGAYCGALGLVEGERATFSLLIRTAERVEGGWAYGVGGGIVIDSDPDRELEELRVKLEALRCAGRP